MSENVRIIDTAAPLPRETEIGWYNAVPKFTIHLFGRDQKTDEEIDWSLAPLQKARDGALDRYLAPRVAAACRLVNECAQWYAPHPTEFNGRIVRPEDLPERILLTNDVTLYRGALAEGVQLPRKSGFMASIGGCAIIVASDGKRMVVAHAGRRSLFRDDPRDHAHRSVVYQIRDRFCGSFNRDNVKIWVFFSIRPEAFLHRRNDPVYAKNNDRLLSALIRSGFGSCIMPHEGIDLPTLVQLQAREAGLNWQIAKNRYLPPNSYHTGRTDKYRLFKNLAVVYAH